jgi:hypothetical protein
MGGRKLRPSPASWPGNGLMVWRGGVGEVAGAGGVAWPGGRAGPGGVGARGGAGGSNLVPGCET